MVLPTSLEVKTGRYPRLRSGAHAALFVRPGAGFALAAFGLDAFKDFFAVDRDVFRRVNAHAHLISLHTEDGHGDFLANHDGLADASSENEHVAP